MKYLRLIPSDTNFNFLKFKKIAFVFSSLIILGSLFSLLFNNLNYGIDFKGGILLELRSNNVALFNIDDLRYEKIIINMLEKLLFRNLEKKLIF